MATFPSLQPNMGRDYGLGTAPMAVAEAPNGDAVPFLWSADVRGVALALKFAGLTLAEADQIQDHYLGQRGRMVSFDLPASVWLAHTSADDVFPSGTLFRYTGAPKRAVNQAGYYEVEVSLLSE